MRHDEQEHDEQALLRLKSIYMAIYEHVMLLLERKEDERKEERRRKE